MLELSQLTSGKTFSSLFSYLCFSYFLHDRQSNLKLQVGKDFIYKSTEHKSNAMNAVNCFLMNACVSQFLSFNMYFGSSFPCFEGKAVAVA